MIIAMILRLNSGTDIAITKILTLTATTLIIRNVEHHPYNINNNEK